MDNFLYFIRDNLVGIHYFIYAFALLFFMFAIIGYLFKQKYAKFDIQLNTSQSKEDSKKEKEVKKVVKELKPEEKKVEEKKVLQKVEVANKEVVSKPIVEPKENYKTPINEITQTPKQETKVVSTPVVGANQMAPQVGIPVPTPLPTTTEVKNAVPLPTKTEEVVATKLATEVKKTTATKTNEPIPELK